MSGAASSIGCTCERRKLDKSASDICLARKLLTRAVTSCRSSELVMHPPPAAVSFSQDKVSRSALDSPAGSMEGTSLQVDDFVKCMTG